MTATTASQREKWNGAWQRQKAHTVRPCVFVVRITTITASQPTGKCSLKTMAGPNEMYFIDGNVNMWNMNCETATAYYCLALAHPLTFRWLNTRIIWLCVTCAACTVEIGWLLGSACNIFNWSNRRAVMGCQRMPVFSSTVVMKYWFGVVPSYWAPHTLDKAALYCKHIRIAGTRLLIKITGELSGDAENRFTMYNVMHSSKLFVFGWQVVKNTKMFIW